MSSIHVVIGTEKLNIPFNEKTDLLTLLRGNGFFVNALCGGNGTCGKCRVTVRMAGTVKQVLSCRTEALDGMEVFLSESVSGGIISGTGEDTVPLNNPAAENGPFGIAADLGTTTVVVSAYDLSSGKKIGEKRAWNRQMMYGSDVMSRISHIMREEKGLHVLSEMIRNQITEMAKALLPEDCTPEKTVISGNTVMQLIFSEKDPGSLGRAPFIPVTDFSGGETDTVPGLGTVYYMPCISGFVGGDITSGLSVLEENANGPVLFMDLGTNGEMALLYDNRILTTAVAMGPAFEGAEISCGMRSEPGAVTRVSFSEKEIALETTGGEAPAGICGSGLLDLLSVLLSQGVITENGSFAALSDIPARLRRYVLPNGKGDTAFYLTRDHKVFLSGQDVRKLQLAIAAVRAGAELLTAHMGIGPEELKKVYIAGGFGKGLNIESAVRCGMLPEEFLNKTESLGNTSLAGAEQYLLDTDRSADLLNIKLRAEHLELSGNAAFNDRFAERMIFPSAKKEE